MDLKNYIVLIVCIVLESSVSIMASKESSASCKFVPNVPNRLMKTMGHSRNYRALVIASGYLRYYDQDKESSQNSSETRYMPLLFKDYDLELAEFSGKHVYLKLKADCAFIRMTLGENNLNWDVEAIDVALDVPNKGIDACRLEAVNMTQVYGSHYKCDHSNCGSKVCRSRGSEKLDIVDVVFTKLEFEVFGSPYKTSIGEFTMTEDSNTNAKESTIPPISVEKLLASIFLKAIGRSEQLARE